MEKQRWEELCEKASKEEDSSKLMALVDELNLALAERDAQRLRQSATA
jgi:hypothetical protein